MHGNATFSCTNTVVVVGFYSFFSHSMRVENHNPPLISAACSDNTWIDSVFSEVDTHTQEREMYARITSLFHREREKKIFCCPVFVVFPLMCALFPAIWRISTRFVITSFIFCHFICCHFFSVMWLFMGNETKVSKCDKHTGQSVCLCNARNARIFVTNMRATERHSEGERQRWFKLSIG